MNKISDAAEYSNSVNRMEFPALPSKLITGMDKEGKVFLVAINSTSWLHQGILPRLRLGQLKSRLAE